MGYVLVEGITTADVAFKAEGKSLEELFKFAGIAVMSIIIKDPESIKGTAVRRIALKEETLELLLYEYLNELLHIKDSENLLVIPDTVKISKKNNLYVLFSSVSGDFINREKYYYFVDVKAVTMHELTVENSESGWSAIFVIDV